MNIIEKTWVNQNKTFYPNIIFASAYIKI